MRILVVGAIPLIVLAASMPLTLGMRTSMRTTSGASSSDLATASSPFSASPTTSMPSSVPSTTYNPRRNRAWSSAMRTRMTSSAAVCTSVTKSPWSGRVDEPDVAVIAPVDDGCPIGLRVGEEEEIVTQQVHLEGRFFGCHGLDGELLGLDDPGPSLV